MKRIKFLLLLALFMGCSETDEVQKEEPKVEEKAKVVEEKVPATVEEDIMRELGFKIEGQKISLDINKTAEFMKQIEIEMHGKADEIERKIERADLNFSRDFGVEVDDTHVAIDLNKTKNMLQQINILMKDILLDGNSTHH